MTLNESIAQGCVADTSFISYLIFTGNTVLLNNILGAPVLLPSVVLDAIEATDEQFLVREPNSELLRPLYQAKNSKDNGPLSDLLDGIEINLIPFIVARGKYWQSAELSENELSLAMNFQDKQVWENLPTQVKKRKRGLGAVQAECLSVAQSRRLTILTDDQAAIDLATALKPTVEVIGICQFIAHAQKNRLISCKAAEHLFNEEICKKWGFRHAKKNVVLQISCKPCQCTTEKAS